MKKLLIFIFTILSLSGYGQTRLELVNIGTGPGVGDGDPLRTAFIKTNSAINAQDSLYGPGTAYIKFKGATSGTVRVEAEAVAGTNKLTAPAETGTLATRANVTTQVNDSLNAIRAAATIGVALADSTGTGEGSYTTGREFAGITQRADRLKAMQEMGSDILLLGIGCLIIPNSSDAVYGGHVDLTAVYIDRIETITGVMFLQGTQGDYTASANNKVGLYSESAGVITLVASSVSDDDLWKGTVGYKKKAFSAPYQASPGVYYIAKLSMYSAYVTRPSLGRNAMQSETQTLFSNYNGISLRIDGQTDLSSSYNLSAATDRVSVFWLGLY